MDAELGCDLPQPIAMLAVGGEDRPVALLSEQARERVAKRLALLADDLPIRERARLVCAHEGVAAEIDAGAQLAPRVDAPPARDKAAVGTPSRSRLAAMGCIIYTS